MNRDIVWTIKFKKDYKQAIKRKMILAVAGEALCDGFFTLSEISPPGGYKLAVSN